MQVSTKDAVINFLLETKAVGWKASDWNLERPDWAGKMRLMSMGKGAKIKLEEKSGEKVFAECLIESYPGLAVQPVVDSSRYFVINVTEGRRNVHLGLGFAERADSFDFNTTLHEHFKGMLVDKLEQEKEIPSEKLDLALKHGESMRGKNAKWKKIKCVIKFCKLGSQKQVEEKLEQEKEVPPEQLDLALKQGETIKVSINFPQKTNQTKSPASSSGGHTLPPPPGPTGSIPAPPSSAMARMNMGAQPAPAPTGGSNQWIQF